MKEKIVLVTGADGGLGRHVTQAFLDAGATVVGLAPKIHASSFPHPGFMPLAGEITAPESALAAVQKIVDRFRSLDVLAHLVGGFSGGKTVAETDDATFQRMFDLNVRAALYILRAVIPVMRKACGGRIITIGSRAAQEPGPGVGAYSASKAALVSLVRTVAVENKDAGITANVLLPGTMDTPGNRAAMPDADRSTWVQPASVASLILWLAGEGGKDVNGAVIPVYGRSL